VWHNIPVWPFGRHPDFVTLHPQQGIVVLEVKDWHKDTIGRAMPAVSGGARPTDDCQRFY